MSEIKVTYGSMFGEGRFSVPSGGQGRRYTRVLFVGPQSRVRAGSRTRREGSGG